MVWSISLFGSKKLNSLPQCFQTENSWDGWDSEMTRDSSRFQANIGSQRLQTDPLVIVQCSAVQCSAVQCSAVQCSAVQFSSVQFSSVQCSAVQCSVAIRCSDFGYMTSLFYSQYLDINMECCSCSHWLHIVTCVFHALLFFVFYSWSGNTQILQSTAYKIWWIPDRMTTLFLIFGNCLKIYDFHRVFFTAMTGWLNVWRFG